MYDPSKLKAMAVVVVIGDAIRDLKQVPAGYLYAHVMSFVTYEEFQKVIDDLVRAKVITRKNHLLTWIGPEKAS